MIDRIARLEDEEGVRELCESFALREVRPGATLEIGPFRFGTRLLPHLVPNMGMKIAAGGATLAYTGRHRTEQGGGGPGRGADVLVAEASWLDDQGEGEPPIHVTARQAAQHAVRADVPRLVPSRFWPTNNRELSRAQAAEAFDGGLTIAQEHLRIEVGG